MGPLEPRASGSQEPMGRAPTCVWVGPPVERVAAKAFSCLKKWLNSMVFRVNITIVNGGYSLVGGFKHFLFSNVPFSYMGCHPSHWLILFKMDKTTNQLLMVVIMVYKPTNITGFSPSCGFKPQQIWSRLLRKGDHQVTMSDKMFHLQY